MKNFRIAIIVSFLFLAEFGAAQPGVLPISKFGGRPNSDITQAFIEAWTQACASPTPTKILIPAGKGVFDGQGAAVWKQGGAAWKKGSSTSTRISMNFGFNFLNNSIIRDITSKDSKFFHINSIVHGTSAPNRLHRK
ncbi:unnamed protein product [Vicia faba]|uniref:Polygalacturonase n=1 Tax=Vicia faba TaxID=3906 RepID=A0AAV0YVQ5_VICFA|nr:unnamed protein product [Vicia faba]